MLARNVRSRVRKPLKSGLGVNLPEWRSILSQARHADPERTALDLLLRGFQISRMLRLVADLGIADRIPPGGSVSVESLAADCKVSATQLIRILRAIAAFRVFSVTADGAIAHTARSLLLRTDEPGSLHHAARFWAAPGSWKAWSELDAALAGGVPNEAAWGMSRFAYLRAHPEEARLFDAMMAAFPDDRHEAIAAAYDFSSAGLVCDVGGGNGAALREVLARFPESRGLVFDLEDVVRAIPPSGLMGGRIATVGGSFFERVPGGADVYMLVRVLHNWRDEDCLRILRACHSVMGRESRLLLGEELLEPDPLCGDPTAYLVDMQMMAMFGGARARTEEEFRKLLADSGFVLRQVIATASSVSIIEATPNAAAPDKSVRS